MIAAALRFRPRVARARASHALALRAAAQELSQLPELVEASSCYVAANLDAARAPLERAVQIVSGFPAPDYKLIVNGGLAQVLRATGEADREASLWQDLLSGCGVAQPAHQLHVLNGVACCALHRGATEEAASACERAFGVLTAETELRAHWAPRFQLHVALGELSSGSAAGAQAAAEAAAEAAAREAEGEAPGEAGAELARRAMAEAAALLLGDALAAGGDAQGARSAWGVLAPAEGAEAAEAEAEAAEGGAALLRRQAALCRVGAAHLAGFGGEGVGGEGAGEAQLSAEGLEAAVVSLKAAVALDARLSSLGALHSAVGAQSLSLLGGGLGLGEQPIAAEGLHRAATDRLRALLRLAPPGMPSGGGELRRVWEAGLLARSLESFATLVAAMEWNGQPRTAEAAQLRQEAAALRAQYAPLLHEHRLGATHPAFAAAGPALAPHAAWGGLEPWYAASLQPDWLAALAS